MVLGLVGTAARHITIARPSVHVEESTFNGVLIGTHERALI